MRHWLLALIVAGCGDSIDRQIEDQITIEQGVYGLLISGCDTTGCQDQPATNEPVMVYAAGEDGAHASVKSDSNGVYQVDLEAGDYTICTYSCTPITVPAFTTVRYDWTSGPGGGRWTE